MLCVRLRPEAPFLDQCVLQLVAAGVSLMNEGTYSSSVIVTDERKLREKVNAFNQKSPVIPAIVTLAFIILPEIAQKLTA